MAAKARVDEAALRAHLRADPGANEALDVTVAAIQSTAEEFAPDKTGYYRRRFRIRRFPMRRRLTNRDPFAHLVEWGSANNPPYAPIRRAVRSLGLKLQELTK